jgi:hypothetical protein
MRRWWIVAASAVTLLMISSSCSSADGQTDTTPTTAVSPATMSPADEAAFDDSVTERIRTEDGCEQLAEGLESREEDLAREAEEPGYIPADRLPVIEERVRVARARMAELGCP